MSVLTGNTAVYQVPTGEREHRKYDLIPHCQYNDGIACEKSNRRCKTCGWNPIVSEMRKQAIEMGDNHFLRFAERDFETIAEDNSVVAPQ